MAGIKDTAEFYLKPQADEELDAFGTWAFGEGFKELIGAVNFMHAWNDLHGQELTLTPTGILSDDMKKMVEIWKEKFIQLN